MVSDIKLTTLATDQVVEMERCELVDLWLTATSGGAATCDVYDGHNTTGKKILVASCVASGSFHLNPKEPIPLENGLYIDLGSNVASCLVLSRRREWESIRE